MKALLVFLRAMAIFFAAALLQWLWSTHFALFGLAPQLLLILTLAQASHRGPVPAMTMGFFWGLFLDSMSARLFGANALVLVLLAYLAGVVRHQMDSTQAVPRAILIAIATLVYFLFFGLVSWIFAGQFSWPGWVDFLILPFYNGLVAAALTFFEPWKRAR